MKKQNVLAVIIVCLSVFFTGVGLVWSTNSGSANLDHGQVLGAVDASSEANGLHDFANTAISRLNDYMQNPATEEELMVKKEKIRQYLASRNSPFAKDPEALDALVRSPHMKLMLEIAFAESTLGKKCIDNNCSNIGSAPDRPYWREYKSLSNWILDFNRLLERRYKDWTLREMCGVYVQPCNENWLAATNQVRLDLERWGIE